MCKLALRKVDKRRLRLNKIVDKHQLSSCSIGEPAGYVKPTPTTMSSCKEKGEEDRTTDKALV